MGWNTWRDYKLMLSIIKLSQLNLIFFKLVDKKNMVFEEMKFGGFASGEHKISYRTQDNIFLGPKHIEILRGIERNLKRKY